MSGGGIIAMFHRRKPWAPKDLFRQGAKGAAYDFTDLSKLWQNTARTTPVTTNGQNIAAFDDISGNGNHQILVTGQTAYVLDTTLGFYTGSTGAANNAGGYQTAGAAGINGSQITAVFGIVDASPAQEGWLMSLETTNTNDAFMVGLDENFANAAQVSVEAFNPGGTSGRSEFIATGAPSITESILAYLDLTGSTYASAMDLRINGSNSGLTQNAAYTLPAGSAFDATKKLTIGCVMTAAIAGPYRPIYNYKLHRAIIVNRALNAQEKLSAESWVLA